MEGLRHEQSREILNQTVLSWYLLQYCEMKRDAFLFPKL